MCRHVVMNKLMLPQLPREAEKVLEQEAKEREKREDKEAEKAKGVYIDTYILARYR